MKNTLLILALSIFYIGGLDAARTIAYASTPPIIDGETDPVWSSSMADVHSIEIEVLAPQTNNPAGRWRGLFDDDFFYFLFEINDANRWGNPASLSVASVVRHSVQI